MLGVPATAMITCVLEHECCTFQHSTAPFCFTQPDEMSFCNSLILCKTYLVHGNLVKSGLVVICPRLLIIHHALPAPCQLRHLVHPAQAVDQVVLQSEQHCNGMFQRHGVAPRCALALHAKSSRHASGERTTDASSAQRSESSLQQCPAPPGHTLHLPRRPLLPQTGQHRAGSQ